MNELTIMESQALAKTLATSQLLPAALNRNPADILVIILTGGEVGFQPMQSIRLIEVIKGVPTIKPIGMMALCLQAPEKCLYFTCISTDSKSATFETHRKGAPEPVRLTYTIEQARTAGLASNSNYMKHPEDMLRSRCIGKLARLVHPDLAHGFYTREEIDEGLPEVDVTPKQTRAEQIAAKLAPPAGVLETIDAVDELENATKAMTAVSQAFPEAEFKLEPTEPDTISVVPHGIHSGKRIDDKRVPVSTLKAIAKNTSDTQLRTDIENELSLRGEA